MRTILEGIIVLLVITLVSLVFILPDVQAGYDHVDRPATEQDCIDALMPIPTATAKQFGNTDKVRLVYNIAELLKAVNKQQVRIASIEKQVAELVATAVIIDPNGVKK